MRACVHKGKKMVVTLPVTVTSNHMPLARPAASSARYDSIRISQASLASLASGQGAFFLLLSSLEREKPETKSTLNAPRKNAENEVEMAKSERVL